MLIASRALAGQVMKTAKTLDTPLPTALQDELRRISLFITAVEKVSAGGLTDAVLTKIAAGQDYHNDKQIIGQLLDHYLTNKLDVVGNARDRANADIAVALTVHTDEVLTGWSKTLQVHAQALADAVHVVPADLSDAKTVTRKGGEALQHWSKAVDAVRLFDAAVDGVVALRNAAGLSPVDKTILMTAADLVTLNKARSQATRQGLKDVSPWILARAGAPLALVSTNAEVLKRTAAHATQRAQAAERYVEQQQQKVSV